jgi:hypothetical protein
MRKILALAVIALMAMFTSSYAADKLAPGPVDVSGKLTTGMMAIGGETTGTILTIPDKGTYELDIKGNKDLQKAVDTLKDKQVKVTGTLSIKAGVEIKERRIIKVDTLVAAPAAAEKK